LLCKFPNKRREETQYLFYGSVSYSTKDEVSKSSSKSDACISATEMKDQQTQLLAMDTTVHTMVCCAIQLNQSEKLAY